MSPRSKTTPLVLLVPALVTLAVALAAFARTAGGTSKVEISTVGSGPSALTEREMQKLAEVERARSAVDPSGPAAPFAAGSGSSPTSSLPPRPAWLDHGGAPSSPSGSATCTYVALSGGVTQIVPTTPLNLTFSQAYNFWSAAAVRSAPGDDWDIVLYDQPAPDPTCVSGPLASSLATTGVDFVIGDYNHDPLGAEYPQVSRYSGTQAAVVEWDAGPDVLSVNGPWAFRTTGPTDVIEVWDVFLSAGAEYTFQLFADTGGVQLLLFRNPASAVYWVGRGAAVFSTSGTATFTAPADDWYGLVVVNDNGGTGSYSVGVGRCVGPTPLASGTSVPSSEGIAYYSLNQATGYWSAVAARPDPGAGSSDWGVELYQSGSGATWPWCFTDIRASSAWQAIGGTEFVVGDFNNNPLGSYYVRSFLATPIAAGGRTEWDSGADVLQVDPGYAPLVTRETNASDLIEIWDVPLAAGQEYTFEFEPIGPADTRLMLFSNPWQDQYWGERNSHVLLTQTTATYTAPLSGDYGVVVVNDNGLDGSYSLAVRTCPTAYPLTSGVGASTVRPHGFFSFSQQTNYWTALGVRGEWPTDWDLSLFLNGAGGSWPTCFSGLIAEANQTGAGVELIAGDFNHNPAGTFFLRPHQATETVMNAATEWDDGPDALVVGAPPVTRSILHPYDVLEAWDVRLEAGQHYDFFFERTGGTDSKLLLFRSYDDAYWAGRGDAVFETTALHTPYTAPASDWYGVVVVHDNGAIGGYSLGVSAAAVAVDDRTGEDAPRVTALRPVAPNPASGSVEFGFDLSAPGAVSLTILDLSGRAVATLPARDWGIGRWSARWDGRDGSRRVAAGVYWVRMSVSGRDIGREKFILLR